MRSKGVSLIRVLIGRDTQELAHSTPPPALAQALRKGPLSPKQEGSCLQAKKREETTYQTLNLPAP